MIAIPDGPSDRRAEFISDSRDCFDVVYDGPGDSTVRPLTGEALKRAIAMREEIAKWAAWDTNPPSAEFDLTIEGE